MQETLFIADIHLDPRNTAIISLFKRFLTQRAPSAEAVYILGDLFESWVGDDEDDPIYEDICQQLQAATTAGTPIYIMHGNRDFLLGEQFCKKTGCQLLDEPSCIELYGHTVLLMHGDSLCTEDAGYQAFRQQVRQQAWQDQFLAAPLAQRRMIAQQARDESQQHTKKTEDTIMDVTMGAVIDVLRQYNSYCLIHGHTHRPASHEFTYNNHRAFRHVVGAWSASRAKILCCTPESVQLETFTSA